MSLKDQQRSVKGLKENNMDDNTKIYNKLSEIKDLLFLLSALELRKLGVAQDGIAKTLKASKTTINSLLKDTKIGGGDKED